MASNRNPARKAALARANSAKLLDQHREAVGDTYTNAPARIGAFTGDLASQGQYPLTRFTQQYMTLLAMYRSHWIVRRIIDVVAEDMLKNAPTLSCDLKPQLIKKFDKVLRDTGTMAKLTMALKWGRLFGGGVAIICIDGHDDLSKPLKLDDVELGAYRGLIPLDRWSGVFPDAALVSDMNYPKEFGLPETYACTMQSAVVTVHHTRLIRFSGRPLPEWERQVEMYWGLSEIEIILDELQKRDYTSWNIVSLVTRAQLLAVKDEQLAQKQSGASMGNAAYNQYLEKMSAMAQSMNNQGMLIVGKDGGIEQTQFSFGGLEGILGMQAADVAGAAEIPMSRLYGRNTSGLGSNGEGDLQIYYDSIETKRHTEVDPAMDKLLPIIAMSTFGKVPDDFDYTWPAIRTMTNKERAELAKDNSAAIKELYEADLLTKREARMELKQASDQNGLGSNLTDEAVAATPDDYASEAGGGELDLPEGDGPAGGPGKPGGGVNTEGREPESEEEEGSSGQGVEKPAKKPEPKPAKKGRAAKDAQPRLFTRMLESFRAAITDAEFKESDHPRAKDGKFGSGGVSAKSAPVMPKGMEHLTKAGHTHGNTWALAQVLEGKHTDKEIEQATKTLYGMGAATQIMKWAKKNKQDVLKGGHYTDEQILASAYKVKGNAAKQLVAWAKGQSSDGQAAQAAVQAGVKANNVAIAAEAVKPTLTPAKLDAALTAAEKPGHKTMYVHAKNSAGKSVYMKLYDLPEGLANSSDVTKLMQKEGYSVSVTSPWDSGKPAPPNVSLISANPAYVKQISDEKYAAAQKEAEAKKPFTELSEELPHEIQQSIKHYTNGSYAQLNKNLRAGHSLTPEQAVLAANLDTAIQKAKLSKDCTIYRKLDAPLSIFGPSIKEGGVWVDNGYISTSKKASVLGVWSGNIKLTIDCKKGGRGIDVQALSLHTWEAEVVLPRGSFFKIKKVNGSGIHLEYLG